MKIKVLPEQVANKIAAGEVIDRPASIVKELIENAIDAGATRVDVEIENGGKRLIRVSDDGEGMVREDVELAFQPHATSKIASAEDLEAIASFGFRGEALPSIASVSRTRLVSCVSGEAVGTEIVIEGGVTQKLQEQGARQGTVVEVRDLFFNTPARRKFLKADTTERGHIQDMFTRLSLSALPVAFSLKVGKRQVFDLPATDDMMQRLKILMHEAKSSPDSFDRDFVPFDVTQGAIRCSGVLGKPALSRPTRKDMHVFINHRWVKSLPCQYALQAGYHGLMMEGRFPVAVLCLEVDPAQVDVNVHPAKHEVRLSNQSDLTSLIQSVVRHVLQSAPDLAPQLKVAPPAAATPISGQGGKSSVRDYTLKPSVDVEQLLAVDAQARTQTQVGQPMAVPETPSETIVFNDQYRVTKVFGQIHKTFILAETEEGFMVVDQHAAHERVMYEALLNNLNADAPEKQMLFLDESLDLPGRLFELYEQAQDLLNQVGFETEPFGEKSIVVRAVPAALGEVNPIETVRTFLEQLEDGNVKTILEDQKEALAALCACKKRSVKARDPMTPFEQRSLLQRLSQCENPFACPHGRPTFFVQSFNDLEKQFKRV